MKRPREAIAHFSEDQILEKVSEMTTNTRESGRPWGHVLTPIPLIEELLEQIPTSMWTNPATRWLDPAAGTGNFGAMIYLKLLRTLAQVIPDIGARKKHILENMLYMVELNPLHVASLRHRFGENHVWSGDFLQLSAPQEPFDVILGNPPFQSLKSLSVYRGSQGKRTAWNAFVKKCLHPDWNRGYLGFITPSTWRRPDAPLYPLMTRENDLKYLHIYGEKSGRDIFKVQTRFDAYVVATAAAAQQQGAGTKIIDEKGQVHMDVDPSEWPFIPNYAFDVVRSIMTSNKDGGFHVIFHSHEHDARRLSANPSEKYCVPVIHTQNRRGLGILYSDRSSIAKKTPKVILNFNRNLYPYNDYLGEYGLSQLSFGLPLVGTTDEERKAHGESLIAFLLSPMFQQVVKATKWTSFQTDYRMFRYLSVSQHELK